MIVKLQAGLYGVVTIIPENKSEVSLICSWGTYFKRIQNCKEPENVLKKIRKTCPLTYQILNGVSDVKFAFFSSNGTYGFVKSLKLDVSNGIFPIVGNKDIQKECYKLLDISVKVYWEIHDHCPLKNWVTGLETIK